MALINTLNLEGTNRRTFPDYLMTTSGVLGITQASGGEIVAADYREQVIPVVTESTLIAPLTAGPGTAKPSVDPTGRNSRYQAWKWPRFTPITEEDERNDNPADLVNRVLGGVSGIMGQSIDDYYLKRIANGASVTEVVYDPMNGWQSLKSVWDLYTTGTARLTGGVITRLGTVELGFTIDGDKRRMDLTEGVGVPIRNSDAAFSLTGGTMGRVLAVYGPWHGSSAAVAGTVDVTRHPDATVDSKGPETGHINYRTQGAIGWGNAYSTDNTGADDGDRFVVLTIA